MITVGVMGAGSIGCFVGGKLAGRKTDVVFVGRERLAREIESHGFTLEDLGEDTVTVAPKDVRFETSPDALAECNIVLCCVKSGATTETADELRAILKPRCVVVSLQNGVRNAEELRARLPDQVILAGIVNFNVLSKGHGVFRRATTGPLLIEALEESAISDELTTALTRAGFEVERPQREKMKALQWSKLLINLNNAISALSDAPTKELVLSAGYRRVLSAVIFESLDVLKAAGIKPAKLGPVPIPLLAAALRLPTPLVRLVARAQLKIDPEARSSMWEDLTSGRPTEIEWINGEVVRLADSTGTPAPLNRRLVAMVQAAEKAKKGSPKLSPRDLWQQMHES